MRHSKRSVHIVLISFLFSLLLAQPYFCFGATTKTYIWNDISSPFEINGGHKMKNGDLVVKLNLTPENIGSAKKIKFYIDYSGFRGGGYSDFFHVRINGSKFKYKVYPSINILARHLKPGTNKIIFDDFQSTHYESGFTIKRLSFRGFKESEIEDVATLKAIRKTKHQLPQSTISTSSEFLKLKLKKAQTYNSHIDAIAVIIGNHNYNHKDIPAVEYANNDASAMKKYLIDTLGYRDGNIIFASNATKAEIEKIFGTKENYRGMLYNYIKPNISEVFIYYSGHGAPDPTTNEAYLVPTDCDPVMMGLTAYPINVLYGNLPKIEAKSITVVIDACFSGGTNTGKWLVPNASPALIKVNNPVATNNNFNILTSSKNNQISSWYPEKRHSMFTYFLLKAVIGDTDLNNDKKITFKEIYDFVSDRAEGVPYYAKRLHGGRIQTPVMHTADEDSVFVEY